jgi:hypothetical protein
MRSKSLQLGRLFDLPNSIESKKQPAPAPAPGPVLMSFCDLVRHNYTQCMKTPNTDKCRDVMEVARMTGCLNNTKVKKERKPPSLTPEFIFGFSS